MRQCRGVRGLPRGHLFMLLLPVLSGFAVAPVVLFPTSRLHLSLVFPFFLFLALAFLRPHIQASLVPFPHRAWYLPSRMVPSITRGECRLLGPPFSFVSHGL